MCSCRFALKQAQIAKVGGARPAGEHRKKEESRERQHCSYCLAPALPLQLRCHNSELVSSMPATYVPKCLGEMSGSPIRGQQVTSSKGLSLVLKTLETCYISTCFEGSQQTRLVQITFGTPITLTYKQKKNAFLSPSPHIAVPLVMGGLKPVCRKPRAIAFLSDFYAAGSTKSCHSFFGRNYIKPASLNIIHW